MRQRDEIESVFGAASAKLSADYFLQLFALYELRDGQPSDRNNQPRLQDFDFFVHPRRAVADFVRSGHSIRSAGRFAGETSANGREINCRSHGGLVHCAKLLEPAEKCLSSRVS